MTWNTLLAVLPALLAVPLFRRAGRWRPLTWMGLAGFLLVLPNAPYVVTDLVHLRGDVGQAASDATVYAGILPLYGAFVAIGFGSYAASLHEVGGWLRRTGRGQLIRPVEIGLHGLCAVGVLLGRVARLNSWDTITRPDATVARALDTLSWRGSPVVIVGLFVVIWLGHSVTRVLLSAAAAWVTRHLPGTGGTEAAAAA
ncbi:MAG: hypothetical protein QOG43_2838 [Actinomycetota bacterium]|nr:hypothetical protein [Actinomycetota bacterium]